MLKQDDFDKLLQAQTVLIIDGALATELELRGYDLNHPLWSAKVLKDDPISIQQVHLDYFLAGADIAITASYQAAPQGLHAHFGISEIDAEVLIARSVQLAQHAREAAYRSGVESTRRLLVAGSVGPYGAYLADGSEYKGDYVRTAQQFKTFHRPRIRALLDANVDLLALETIPSIKEIQALLELLQEEFLDALAWLSCTTKSSEGISDGTPWTEVLELVHQYPGQIVGVGINCVPMSGAGDTLQRLHKLTKLPLVCYPNSGETWNAENKTWEGDRPDDMLLRDSVKPHRVTEVLDWAASGAKLVGGCCRTGPTFIQAVRDHLKLAN